MSSEKKCRICGCTEDNCEKCIRQTGKPCYWVEDDLCSACQESITQFKNQKDMNFFQQLAEAGNVDMTIRIMQKNDKLTLNIMPGSSNSTTKPMIISGTGADLDEEFFKTIKPAVDEVAGIRSNIEEVIESEKKEAEAESKSKTKPASKAAPQKKEAKKPEVKKTASKKTDSPKPVPQNLFEEGSEEKEDTDNDADQDDTDDNE